MVWPFLILLASVAAGILLALVPRQKESWVGAVRTFALTAALSVVLVHLFPEAYEGMGAWAFVALAVGFVTPELVGRAGALLWRAQADAQKKKKEIALEASYFGLLVHHVGDGLGLGAFTGELAASEGSSSVVTALAAHVVPVVAIVVLTFDAIRGRQHALVRAGGLALASFVGVIIAQTVPAVVMGSASAWISALVGGTLLHVVSHDLERQAPTTTSERSWDLAAGVLGILVSLVGHGEHAAHGVQSVHEAHEPFHELSHLFTEELLFALPLLLFAVALGSWLRSRRARLRDHAPPLRSSWGMALRGWLSAGSAAHCACQLEELAERRESVGASRSSSLALLWGAPGVSLETVFLAFYFLGLELSLLWWAGLGLGTLLVVGIIGRGAEIHFQAQVVAPEGETVETNWGRFLWFFDARWGHASAWLLLGVLLAALVEVFTVADVLHVEASVCVFALTSLVVVLSSLCPLAVFPLAAAVLHQGYPVGAVLVGLLLGTSLRPAQLAALARRWGALAVGKAVLLFSVFAWGLGLGAEWVLPSSKPHLGHGEGAHEGSVGLLLVASFAVLLLVRAIWRVGLRSWISELTLAWWGHAHEHEHLHAHEHENEAPGGA